MILAIDIGNTTVALGGIKDGRVCFVAHMDTVRTRTAAEYRAEMEKVFSHRRHPERPVRFEGAVLTSVVPQITPLHGQKARHRLAGDPHRADHGGARPPRRGEGPHCGRGLRGGQFPAAGDHGRSGHRHHL